MPMPMRTQSEPGLGQRDRRVRSRRGGAAAGASPADAATPTPSLERPRAPRGRPRREALERWLNSADHARAGRCARAARPRRTRAASPPGAMPLRPSPVSSLRCTPTGRSADAAAAACCSWSKLEIPSSMPAAAASAKTAPGACSHARIGATMPARRSASASPMSATPSRVGAALERRDRRAHGAVPVAVGLDDGDDLGAGAAGGRWRTFAVDRAEVDRRLAQRRRRGSRLTRRPLVPRLRFGDDERDREARVVRHREVQAGDAALGDDLGGRAGEREPGSPRCLGHDLASRCQCTPSEPPSALMSASFAAKRAASDRSGERVRSRRTAARAGAACARSCARSARCRRGRRRSRRSRSPPLALRHTPASRTRPRATRP